MKQRVIAAVMLAFILTTFVALLSGCNANVIADQDRLTAVEPVIGEHVERHPEQAQTWADFLQSWRESIEARRGN